MKKTTSKVAAEPRIKIAPKIEPGDIVKHVAHGCCCVIAITASGRTLTLRGVDGTRYPMVSSDQIDGVLLTAAQAARQEVFNSDIAALEKLSVTEVREQAERVFKGGLWCRWRTDFISVVTSVIKKPKPETILVFSYLLAISELECNEGGREAREREEGYPTKRPQRWKNAWIGSAAERMQKDTGLTRKQQERAMQPLIDAGLLFYRVSGTGKVRRRFLINYMMLNRELQKIEDKKYGIGDEEE